MTFYYLNFPNSHDLTSPTPLSFHVIKPILHDKPREMVNENSVTRSRSWFGSAGLLPSLKRLPSLFCVALIVLMTVRLHSQLNTLYSGYVVSGQTMGREAVSPVPFTVFPERILALPSLS